MYHHGMLTRRSLFTTLGAALVMSSAAAAQKKGAEPKLATVTLEISGMT